MSDASGADASGAAKVGAARVGDALEADLRRIAATETLLVALDFDGTLAPLVDRPEDARALPEAREAIDRLRALPNTPVALISGRAIDSLLVVADPHPDLLLSGSHGVEARLGGTVTGTLTAQEVADLRQLRRILDGVIERHPGIRLEVKPAGFALHDRGEPADVAAAAQADATALVAATLPQVTVRHGSHVLEFSVRSTTKGDAIRMLRAHASATAVLFVGDDVTDEDGFRELGADDVGIKCGPGATAAAHRVADPPAVARMLHRLADIRHTDMPERESKAQHTR